MKSKKITEDKKWISELLKLLLFFSGGAILLLPPIGFMVVNEGKDKTPEIWMIISTALALLIYASTSISYLMLIKKDYDKPFRILMFTYTILAIVFMIILYSCNLEYYLFNHNEFLLIIPIFIIFLTGIVGTNRFGNEYSKWIKEKKKRVKNEN